VSINTDLKLSCLLILNYFICDWFVYHFRQAAKMTLNQIASKSSSVTTAPPAMTSVPQQQPFNSQAPLITPNSSLNVFQPISGAQQPNTTLPMVPPPAGGVKQSPAKIPTQEILSLADIFIPLETIQPSKFV